MTVIFIGTDRKILETGSAVRNRVVEYGKLFNELHVVVFTVFTEKQTPVIKASENIFIYPTNSTSKFNLVFDAFRICRSIILRRHSLINNLILSTQDPFETGIIGIGLKLLYKARLQIQLHTDFHNKYFPFSSPLNFVRFFLAYITLPYADSVRCVSRRIKESIKELNNDIVILPIQAQTPEQDLGTGDHNRDPVLLTICRIEKEKNVETALRAFGAIASKYPEITLVIAGDGSKKCEMEKLALNLKVQKRVKFLGWVENLGPLYSSALIYISTSLFEGYGMSVVEAAKSGLPLVLSDAGVAGEVFKEKDSAFICKPKDVNCFAKALDKLISDGKMRKEIGRRAKEAALKNSIPWNQYLDLYKKAIESAAGGSQPGGFVSRLKSFITALFDHNRVLRFITAGGFVALTQILLLYIFTDLFGIWYLLSSTLSFVYALIASFFLQKLWAFKDGNMAAAWGQFAKFTMVPFIGITINTSSMYFLVEIVGLWYILAQFVTGFVIAIINFLIYRFYIFSRT